MTRVELSDAIAKVIEETGRPPRRLILTVEQLTSLFASTGNVTHMPIIDQPGPVTYMFEGIPIRVGFTGPTLDMGCPYCGGDCEDFRGRCAECGADIEPTQDQG